MMTLHIYSNQSIHLMRLGNLKICTNVAYASGDLIAAVVLENTCMFMSVDMVVMFVEKSLFMQLHLPNT